MSKIIDPLEKEEICKGSEFNTFKSDEKIFEIEYGIKNESYYLVKGSINIFLSERIELNNKNLVYIITYKETSIDN